MIETRVLVTLSVATLAAVGCVAAPASVAAAQTVAPAVVTQGVATSVGKVELTAASPDSWVGLTCQGEFVVPSITGGKMFWGAEQSCTEPTSQSFSLVLTTSYGTVGIASAAGTGNQIYTHQYTACSSTANTQYVEESYAYVNGNQVKPYPTTAVFSEPCRLPVVRSGCATPAVPGGSQYGVNPVSLRRTVATRPDC